MPLDDRLFALLLAARPEQLDIVWSSDLRRDVDDEDYEGASTEERVALLSAEIRSVAGHTLRNLRREDHEMPWEQILLDVVNQLAPSRKEKLKAYEKERGEMEALVLEYADRKIQEAWDKLPDEERNKIFACLEETIEFEGEQADASMRESEVRRRLRTGISSAIAAGLFAGGGAAALAATAASAAASVAAAQVGGLLLGGGLGTLLIPLQAAAVETIRRSAFKTAFVRALPAALGTAASVVGLVTIPATVAHIVMSPSYRKLVPAVVHVLSWEQVNASVAEAEASSVNVTR